MLKKFTKKNHIARKEFNYEKGDVSLRFALRIDQKKELKAFKVLLERAIEDIDSELEAL